MLPLIKDNGKIINTGSGSGKSAMGKLSKTL